METLLFGGVLPPPLPPPDLPDVAPRAPTPPRPEVPTAVKDYRAQLRVVEQQELMLLREREWRPEELKQRMGINKNALAGLHSRMARLSATHGVPLYVLTKGKARWNRRYMLPDEGQQIMSLLVAAGVV